MSSPGLNDSQLGHYTPASSGSNRQLKDLTDASSAIAVVEGWYRLWLSTTSIQPAIGKIGGAATVPTTAAAAAAGFVIAPNTWTLLRVRSGETDLRAIMAEGSATGKLWIERVR